MRATRVSRLVKASRSSVYSALIDPEAVAGWRVPAGMTSHVHTFEAREGGRVRISLTYDAPTRSGKTTARTDTFHGWFVELVPNERVVEVDEFETSDPTLRGQMKTTITLTAVDGGTEVTGVREDLLPGLSLADNEAGRLSALARLAELVEPG